MRDISTVAWTVLDWFCKTDRRKTDLAEAALAAPALALALPLALAGP